MNARELVRHHPRLYHMTALGSWPTIERLGLLSVTALLDLFEMDGETRHALESQHRPHTVSIRHPAHGEVVIRDQAPLSMSKLAACLTDMTVTDWLRLLNRKVFFWLSEQRVERLLGAQLYRHLPHLVLVIDTRSLVAAHEAEITLAPINTGAVLFDPQPRGSDTLLPIAQYDFQHWRARRGARSAIAELAVDYAVPDLHEHVVRVERRQHQQPKEILSKGRGDRLGGPAGAGGDTVAIGRTVHVFDTGSGNLHVWTVVSPSQADAASGRLSANSPIAKALLGRKPGEIVTADTPRGPRQLEIKELT